MQFYWIGLTIPLDLEVDFYQVLGLGKDYFNNLQT
jgi:hypothetical protein